MSFYIRNLLTVSTLCTPVRKIDFINAGNGGGIGWALIDDITQAEVKEETIINHRHYHTIKEVKNGEGPHPIKTSRDGYTSPTVYGLVLPDCVMYSICI